MCMYAVIRLVLLLVANIFLIYYIELYTICISIITEPAKHYPAHHTTINQNQHEEGVYGSKTDRPNRFGGPEWTTRPSAG